MPNSEDNTKIICKHKYMPELCKNTWCKDILPDGRCPNGHWSGCSDKLRVSDAEYVLLEYMLKIQTQNNKILQEINNLKQNQK